MNKLNSLRVNNSLFGATEDISTGIVYKKVLELESFVETSERATTEEPIYLSVRENPLF